LFSLPFHYSLLYLFSLPFHYSLLSLFFIIVSNLSLFSLPFHYSPLSFLRLHFHLLNQLIFLVQMIYFNVCLIYHHVNSSVMSHSTCVVKILHKNIHFYL
jgi:hypothetical protein